MPRYTILVATPDDGRRAELSKALTALGIAARQVRSADEIDVHLGPATRIDACFIDPDIGRWSVVVGQDGRSLWPVVLVGSVTSETLVAGLQAGFVDSLGHSDDPARVAQAVVRAVHETKRRRGIRPATDQGMVIQGWVDELRRAIRKGDIELPEEPRILRELREVIGDERSTWADIARVVELDGPIAARVMALANRAAQTGRAETVTDAVSRLGRSTVLNEVVTLLLHRPDRFEVPRLRDVFERMWSVYVRAAHLARELLAHDHEAYLHAILYKIGELHILWQYSDHIQRNKPADWRLDEILMVMAGQQSILGAEILGAWNFGESYVDVARCQASPEGLSEPVRSRAMACILAWRLIESTGLGYAGEVQRGPSISRCFDELGIKRKKRADWHLRAHQLATVPILAELAASNGRNSAG